MTDPFLWIVVMTVVGRVVLSWLPPGRPGYHEPRELPLTLATSYLLGSVVWTFESMLLGAQTSLLFRLAPWVVVALIRLATLPGALVPRHEPLPERPSPLARALFGLAIAIILVPAFLGVDHRALTHDDARVAIVCMLVIVADGFAAARRRSLGSAMLVLALSAYCMWEHGRASLSSCACFGAGAAFAIRFFRHGDRRAQMLAVLFFAALQADPLDQPALALAALVALVVAAPSPLRARTATGAAIAFAVACLPLALQVQLDWYEMFGHHVENLGLRQSSLRGYVLRSTFGFAVATGALGLVALGFRRSRRTREGTGMIDEPARELAFLGVLLALGLVAIALESSRMWRSSGRSLDPFHRALMPLVPVALLWIGLIALGPEKARRA